MVGLIMLSCYILYSSIKLQYPLRDRQANMAYDYIFRWILFSGFHKITKRIYFLLLQSQKRQH